MYSHDAPPASSRLNDPFYYLLNFQDVLDWILSRYGDLLDARERAFIEQFPELPRPARALLVRMIMRKGSRFRASKLRYAEIGDPRAVAGSLAELGWIDPDPALTLEQVFPLLTRSEILAAFDDDLDRANLRKNARKDELLAGLAGLYPGARSLAGWCPALNDCVFALTVMDLCDRFRLLFFGNLRQDWSEFVLADLGIYQYETVPFTPESRAFQRRADVDAYIYMHDCRDRFEAGEAVSDVLADVPRQAHANPWLEARRGKLLYSLAQQFERDGALADAQALYRDCTYPGARVRCIRVLERCEELETAYAMAEQALEDPESEAERQHLDRILPRLRRKLGHPKQPRAESVPVSRIDVTLTRQLPVELAVRDHFHRDDAPVHYVENTLINGLFGLLCWDVLFAPLPGAFFHPFQRGPADLLRPDFQRRRADAFRERFAELDSSAYRSTIRHHYRAKFNLQSPFVVWGALTPALLDAALDCLPPAHLKLWFERLLRDIRANRAGMPDLIQFYPEERRYRMIEVKGPGDRLQDNQLRWLDFCARHDMPVDVCYVSWSDDGPNGGDRA